MAQWGLAHGALVGGGIDRVFGSSFGNPVGGKPLSGAADLVDAQGAAVPAPGDGSEVGPFAQGAASTVPGAGSAFKLFAHGTLVTSEGGPRAVALSVDEDPAASLPGRLDAWIDVGGSTALGSRSQLNRLPKRKC